MFSMRIEECQASELRGQIITASADGCKKTMSLGPTLAKPKPELCIWCKKATYSGRAYLNLSIGQNIIQLIIKWTIDIVTKYHSKLFIIWNDNIRGYSDQPGYHPHSLVSVEHCPMKFLYVNVFINCPPFQWHSPQYFADIGTLSSSLKYLGMPAFMQ